jgi:rhodanese-related sulfurtransferase
MGFFSQLIDQSGIQQLNPAQLQTMLLKSPRPFLLDVRTPQEYKEGHIQDAELIPLNELANQLNRIPKEREVICICQSGSRSSVAAQQLNSLGYKVSNLRGGMELWARAGLPVKMGMDK